MKAVLLSFIISISLYCQTTLELSELEKKWINQNPVVTYSEVDWKPLSIIENGRMNGIMGDYLDLVSSSTGIQFKYIKSSSWSNVLEKFKNKEIDLVPGIGSSPQEAELGLISNRYAKHVMAIVTKNNYNYIENLDMLSDKTIAIPKHYTSYNFVKSNYPKIKVIPTNNIQDALTLVEIGKADAFVGHIATSIYYIGELNYSDLKICGTTEFMFEHHYLIQKDNEILLSIINKAFDSITEEQINDIYARWIDVKVEQKINIWDILQIVLIALFIIIALMLKQRTLARYNAQLKEQAHIIEQIHDCVISTDLNGVITKWNYGSEELLGYKSSEMIGEKISKIYLEEDRAYLNKIISKVKAAGTNISEVRLISKSGKIIFVELSTSLVRDANQDVIGIIGFSRDISKRSLADQEIIRQKEELDYLAHHDILTGIANRTLYLDRIEQAIHKAKRNETEIAILYIDLDMFKQINDLYGHSMGDKVLKEVADRLKSVIRESDTIARLGGDEFSIILEGNKQEKNASMISEKIINTLNRSFIIDSKKMYIDASIGISLYPKNSTDLNELLFFADSAMYKAKDEGRNNYQFYSQEMTEKTKFRSIMQVRLREAMVNKEFVIHYQPQIDTKKNKVTALEALIRWNKYEEGLIMPDKFIDIADEIGLLVDIDRWMIKTAIEQAKIWSDESLEVGKISLNLTFRQLMTDKFIPWIKYILEKNNLDAKYICFEITEEEIMKNSVKIIDKLNTLSELGIELAIDDFGAWYSSISTLKKLPINKVKIDRTFISHMEDCKENVGVTKAIIDLSSSLNLGVVAEGVENEKQKDFLVANGCWEIQGYLYSKPMPAEDVTAFIKKLES